MKRGLSICLALLLLLGSCGGSGEKTLHIGETAEALYESEAFAEPLFELEQDTAFMMYQLSAYGVEAEAVEECRVFVAQSVIADELALFRLTSEEAAKQVERALVARVKTQSEAFSGYGPEEVPKLTDSRLVRSGTTVYLVVATNYGAVDGILS